MQTAVVQQTQSAALEVCEEVSLKGKYKDTYCKRVRSIVLYCYTIFLILLNIMFKVMQ